MDRILDLDTDLLLWINSHHTPALDWVMWTASQVWSWAVVMVLIYVLLTLHREPRRWWLVLLAGMLCFLLSDRISVLAFKQVFQRPRPCHAIEGLHMFRTGCGGLYGFVSSHAANIFALVTFFVMRYCTKARPAASPLAHAKLKTTRARLLTALALVLWAVLVCYSRPYLGKHYPGDVLCGALLGIVIGLAVHGLATLADRKLETRETQA